ncbi:hypothetical protein NPIL_117181 [Nephila pilipes]|uniref:Uncharacterized protein n=1 Tax=Nephila pilipes TaxID=299642 RepID=A0A8X6UU44_NEPPI|nr:hypothetical protein NPIL_234411 [Nephila pilipes]GFU43635.1 hypothetical protein NPIL_117181 [Nephila pilipes]
MGKSFIAFTIPRQLFVKIRDQLFYAQAVLSFWSLTIRRTAAIVSTTALEEMGLGCAYESMALMISSSVSIHSTFISWRPFGTKYPLRKLGTETPVDAWPSEV